MTIDLLDWLNLLLRFVHVVTAIAWIGASFYFIWLDLSLQPPSDEKLRRGLAGELWAIHGGGIYEVGKYQLHPQPMPTTLHWFKWEAYSTWLSGSALLVTYYYLRSDSTLISAQSWVQSPVAAVSASVGFLLAGLTLYEAFMRAWPKISGTIQMGALLALLSGASWLAFQAFAPRAAIVHIGAMLATLMAANVLMTIIPAQKALVAAIDAGESPDPNLAIRAKARSTHNNYLTLPVLFCMLSSHSPMVFGHPHAWIVVVAVSLAAMVARHFFNAKHAGRLQPGYLISAGLGFVGIAVAAAATSNASLPAAQGARLENAALQSLVTAHCSGCHSEAPTHPGFARPPGGYLFRTPEDLRTQRELVAASLRTQYMPLGNLTGLTPQERADLLAWTVGER